MATITSRGAEIPKTPEVMAAVRRDLVVTPFSPQQSFPRPFRVFVETPSKVIVPLHWARKALPHVPREDARPLPGQTNLEFAGTLRPELRQLEAAQAVEAAWRERGGAMLCLPTGFGKTTTSLYLACRAKTRTLVVVMKDFLARQWEDRIRQFVPGATVTRVQGAECDTSGDFVIAMLQTLVSRAYPAPTFAACGLVIVDEAHHVAAQAFSQAMWALSAPLTLGLTATPDRKDRLGRVVEWFMGDIAYMIKRENQAGTAVRVRRYTSARFKDPPPINRRGDVCYASILTELTADDARTDVVADAAQELTAEGHDVLVLSHRRQHCVAIADRLRARGVDCATYLGGDKVVPDTRVIVATYALTSEGFDCPRLTGLVLATPASDVEQSCGRVMRGSSAQSAAIVDVVDEWGVCYAQHAKRKAFYRRSGFAVAHSREDREDREDSAPEDPAPPTQPMFVDDA